MNTVEFSRACGDVLRSDEVLALPPSEYQAFERALLRADTDADLTGDERAVFLAAGGVITEAYVERLHPRDRVGRWARKFGGVQHALNALVSTGGTTELLQGTPKRKRGRGGRKAPLKRRATADWKARVGALAQPVVPARFLLDKRRTAMMYPEARETLDGGNALERREADEYLTWWFGEYGRPGAMQRASGDPGTLFTAQHARIMEAGAILDAEITRRMNADPKLKKRRELERMLREAKAKRTEAEQVEYAATWEFLARRMNEHDEVMGRNARRHLVEHKTPEEWAAIHAEYERHTKEWYSRQMKWKIPDAEKYGPALWDLYEFRYTDAEREGVDLQAFYDRVYEAKSKVWDIERSIDDLGIDDRALRRDQAYEVLREIREFGDRRALVIYDDQKGRPIPLEGEPSEDWPHPRFMSGVTQLAEAAKWLPLDWVTDSNEHHRKLTVGWSEDRGKYIHTYSPWLVAMSGEVTDQPKPGRSRIIGSPSPIRPGVEMGEGTMVHELVHRVEQTRDGITGAEWAFYVSRVSPGTNRRWPDAEKISEVTGNDTYEVHEVTRTDEFTNAYSGKTYGDEMDSSWEILTMGIEDLVTGEKGIIEKDDEYRQFVLGSLALL